MGTDKKFKRETLPLLDSLKDSFPKEKFENILVIVCQHILESNFILINSLIKGGVMPKNVFILGKSYSSSPKIIKKYKELGVNVDKNSSVFDSHVPFDEQFKEHIRNFLIEITNKDLSPYNRILILDDGGELILQANDLFRADNRVVAVEQTASGYHKIKSVVLNFPVINVAMSKAKLDYESPMIAEMIVKELFKRLNQIDKKAKKILVLGNGPIGASITKSLREDFKVFVYDKSAERTELTSKDLMGILPECDVIVGCSGQTSILESHYNLLKKEVMLVSASSSDREFESHKIRRLHEKTSNTHKDFHVGDIILLNGGFPLNFDGDKVSIPMDQIQLTEALMLAGAIQAIETSDSEKGVISLNEQLQEDIIKEFSKIQHG